MTKSNLDLNVNIGPAWLLLSHAAFIASMISASTIGFSFLTSNPASAIGNARALGIVWSSLGIVIGIFVIYAIVNTWKENRKLKRPTFGDEGFIMLISIVVMLIGATIYTIVEVAIAAT